MYLLYRPTDKKAVIGIWNASVAFLILRILTNLTNSDNDKEVVLLILVTQFLLALHLLGRITYKITSGIFYLLI